VKNRTILIVVVLAVILLGGVVVVPKVIDQAKNGSVLGVDYKRNSHGAVDTDPAVILAGVNAALLAGGRLPIDRNQLALARSLRSEHGSDSVQVRRWVGWAIRNAAGGADKIFSKLTTKSGSAYTGKYADQHTDARFAATGQSARELEIELAREILSAPQASDPTGGATNFFSPRAQDRLYRDHVAGVAGAALVTKGAADKRSEWIGFGWQPLGAPSGTASDLVEFFRNPSVRIG
jgi:hypothetical protein